MKLLVDTNILGDVFYRNREDYESSRKVIELCQLGLIKNVVSALSVANLAYVVRRAFPAPVIREIVKSIIDSFSVEDLKAIDFEKAMTFDMRDFEDAIQAACAVRTGADYIITRNVKDFRNSPVPAITPEEFLRDIAFTN